jgi:predicted phosphoribosyltransferase
MVDAPLPYRDRAHAGRELARRLDHYRGAPGLLVLGLARGGLPVAAEVAHALDAPLDVLVVRKLGHPLHGEFAIGAIAPGGVQVMTSWPGLRPAQALIARVVARERQELARREALYRGGRPAPDVRGRTVIVVDDGLATGATMEAAVQSLRQAQPARLCVAAPVAAQDTCARFAALADEVVCAATPEPFRAVGLWYREFPQLGDDEVQRLLDAAGHRAEEVR